MLHLNTTAVQALPKLENLDGLSRGELAERAFQALAAVAREKSRNAELVHKLQQLHTEGLQFKELQKRHSELQVSLRVRQCGQICPWTAGTAIQEAAEVAVPAAGCLQARQMILRQVMCTCRSSL